LSWYIALSAEEAQEMQDAGGKGYETEAEAREALRRVEQIHVLDAGYVSRLQIYQVTPAK
jgi:hypothetical protein